MEAALRVALAFVLAVVLVAFGLWAAAARLSGWISAGKPPPAAGIPGA